MCSTQTILILVLYIGLYYYTHLLYMKNEHWTSISARAIADNLSHMNNEGFDPLRLARDIKYGHPSYAEAETKEREMGSGLEISAYWRDLFGNLELELPGKRILTIGGNSGIELLSMPGINHSTLVVNTDISLTALHRGVLTHKFPCVQADCQSMPFQDNSQDLITCFRTFAVLDHAEKHNLIEEVKRMLVSNGEFVFSIPAGFLNRDNQIITGQLVDGIVDPNKPLNDLNEIASLVSTSGFQLIKEFNANIELFCRFIKR